MSSTRQLANVMRVAMGFMSREGQAPVTVLVFIRHGVPLNT